MKRIETCPDNNDSFDIIDNDHVREADDIIKAFMQVDLLSSWRSIAPNWLRADP